MQIPMIMATVDENIPSKKNKGRAIKLIINNGINGGDDGTRTHGLLRDRQTL